jgi:hypothetical protein
VPNPCASANNRPLLSSRAQRSYMATESSNRALSFDVAARGGPRRAQSVSPDYQMSLTTILSARLLRVAVE